MDKKHILMIEDEENVLALNERTLVRFSGGAFRCDKARSLAEARTILADTPEDFDLIMLDITLPDGSGLDFVDEAHAVSHAPILILSARNTREEVIEGLQRGGDNYITKPYDPDDLCARVFAMLRREDDRRNEPPEKITCGAITLDLVAGRAEISGADMLLTGKEFALLSLFAQNEGRTMSAEYLYEKIWKQPMTGDDGAIKNIVYKLRKKLADTGYAITNERSEGYTFQRQ